MEINQPQDNSGHHMRIQLIQGRNHEHNVINENEDGNRINIE